MIYPGWADMQQQDEIRVYFIYKGYADGFSTGKPIAEFIRDMKRCRMLALHRRKATHLVEATLRLIFPAIVVIVHTRLL